ncbi:MAG: hypothetical protein U1F77_00375 [Kiritimatiellia bacterium]
MNAWLNILVLPAAAALPAFAAGPYSDAADDPGNAYDPPVPGFVGPGGDGLNVPENSLNPRFVAWASSVVSYLPADGVDPVWADAAKALGPVTGDQFDVVSLGERAAAALDAGQPPGSITLGFTRDIADAPGADFAVFENGFHSYVELAFVEVSTDGSTFARFPARCLTAAPVGAYGTQDPTELFDLAGKHMNNNGDTWGTPFDLARLAGHPAVLAGTVDLRRIRYVRLVDIPGRGDFKDSTGAPVYDVWPTFGSGGFDLEAVGVIHPREELVAGTPADGLLPLWCESSPHRSYQLASVGVTVTGTRAPVGGPVTGTGGILHWSVPDAGPKFYRLDVTEAP